MRLRRFFAILFCAVAAPLAGASAAPQALGLVATSAPVPLSCFGGTCAAELSTFCLQQNRDIPRPGTPYRATGDGLTLIAISADGKTRRLPGGDHLSISSRRGFSTVRISVASAALEEIGAVRAAVEVGEKVTLMPVPVAGDPDPQSAPEIAAATGSLRSLGDEIIDKAGAEAEAARLAGAMINGLPDQGRVGVAAADRLWSDQIEARDPAPETLAEVGEMYRICRARVEAGLYYNIRRCLEQQHDELMLELNQRFWRAILGS